MRLIVEIQEDFKLQNNKNQLEAFKSDIFKSYLTKIHELIPLDFQTIREEEILIFWLNI